MAAQVAEEVTSAVEPSLYFAVAVNCSVEPADMLALAGDTDTEVSVFACETLVEEGLPPHAMLTTASESERRKAGIEIKRQQWRLVPIDFLTPFGADED